jgi:hypothetical protein
MPGHSGGETSSEVSDIIFSLAKTEEWVQYNLMKMYSF